MIKAGDVSTELSLEDFPRAILIRLEVLMDGIPRLFSHLGLIFHLLKLTLISYYRFRTNRSEKKLQNVQDYMDDEDGLLGAKLLTKKVWFREVSSHFFNYQYYIAYL